MKTLLRIDASSRTWGSHSRHLGNCFEKLWKAHQPGDQVIHRDLAIRPLPHVTHEAIMAFQARGRARHPQLQLSDALCDELLGADHVVISSPLYNLSMPSTLKAWIDHVARPGKTFTVRDGVSSGLVRDSKATVITTRGSLESEAQQDDFQTAYLHAFLRMLGFRDILVIAVDGTSLPESQRAPRLARAREQIAARVGPPALQPDTLLEECIAPMMTQPVPRHVIG